MKHKGSKVWSSGPYALTLMWRAYKIHQTSRFKSMRKKITLLLNLNGSNQTTWHTKIHVLYTTFMENFHHETSPYWLLKCSFLFFHNPFLVFFISIYTFANALLVTHFWEKHLYTPWVEWMPFCYWKMKRKSLLY